MMDMLLKRLLFLQVVACLTASIAAGNTDTRSEVLNILDYGVVQNKVQTAQIQKVIDDASSRGGLTLVIPRGTFISGTLNLKNASLRLDKGAVLKGSSDINDYRHNGYRHNEMRQVTSLIYSLDNDDISITGEGTIDLNASAFYDMDAPNIPKDGLTYAQWQQDECTRLYEVRPTQPIFFANCKHLLISGITIRKAPCWTMSFSACEDVKVLDLTIDNDMNVPNNDGMHFCGCRNVIVRGCNIASGDDCIALSGITDWDRPCENVTISDCVMTSASKTLSIGYMHSIVRNVTVSNCVIYGSQRGIAFMASKGTGIIEHIQVSNVRIETYIHAGYWWGHGEPICLMATFHHYDGYLDPIPKRDVKVSIRDINFQNISCTGENIIGVIGDNDNIRDITFDHVTFESKPSRNKYIRGERYIDVSPSSERIEYPEDFKDFIFVRQSRNVNITNCSRIDNE